MRSLPLRTIGLRVVGPSKSMKEAVRTVDSQTLVMYLPFHARLISLLETELSHARNYGPVRIPCGWPKLVGEQKPRCRLRQCMESHPLAVLGKLEQRCHSRILARA